MRPETNKSLARTHDRHACRMPVRLLIDPIHSELVVLSKKVRGKDGAISAMLVDCGFGGLGIESDCFVPKGCHVRIRVVVEEAAGADAAELPMRVQRVIMQGSGPKYLLGMTFGGGQGQEENDEQVGPLLQKLVELVTRNVAAGSSQRA